MFNDDGLGQAIALSAAESAGKEAQKSNDALAKRVKELEREMAAVHEFLRVQLEINKSTQRALLGKPAG